jgi:hypothetical protein
MITLNGVIIFPWTYFVLSFMLSFDVIIFNGQQMLSFLCYHFPCTVHILCYHLSYHLMLSFIVIISPLFSFF